MQYHMIALDMDGTVLDNQSNISLENLRAMEVAVRQGYYIIPCSGRSYYELPEEIRMMEGIQYAVVSNGASMVRMSDEKVLLLNAIPLEEAMGIYRILEAYDCLTEVYAEGNPHSQRDKTLDLHYFRVEEKYHKVLVEARVMVEDMDAFLPSCLDGVEKFNIFFRHHQEKLAFIRRMEDYADRFELTGSMHNNVEINRKGVSKGATLKALCQYLQVDQGKVVAVGDSDNDMTMLEFAGMPVAVDNASEPVKRAARAVTVSNDESAAAQVIQDYLGIYL